MAEVLLLGLWHYDLPAPRPFAKSKRQSWGQGTCLGCERLEV